MTKTFRLRVDGTDKMYLITVKPWFYVFGWGIGRAKAKKIENKK